MRNKKSKIRKGYPLLPMWLSIFATVWSLCSLWCSLSGKEVNYVLLLPSVIALIGAFLFFKLTKCSSNSNTKSVNIISVDLVRIDVTNYSSDWVLDDSTQPIQYGAHGEYMIWFLQYRTYWFAVDIGKEGGHDFYAFDVRKIANDADMPILMEDIDLYYKREWLTRFLRDLAEKECFLDFRNNDVDRQSSNQSKNEQKTI